MAADDLSAPLGQQKTQKRRSHAADRVPQAVAAALSLSLVVFAAWAMIADDPVGGEPIAVVSDRAARRRAAKPDEPAAPRQAGRRLRRQNAGPARRHQTVTIIDGTSGKRQQVAIPGGAGRQVGG